MVCHQITHLPNHFEFQATLDDVMTGVSTLYYSTASNADSTSQDAALGEREQSLLHAKLYEKNASLSRYSNIQLGFMLSAGLGLLDGAAKKWFIQDSLGCLSWLCE